MYYHTRVSIHIFGIFKYTMRLFSPFRAHYCDYEIQFHCQYETYFLKVVNISLLCNRWDQYLFAVSCLLLSRLQKRASKACMQWCGKDLLIFTHHSHITSNGKTRGRRVHFKPIGICFEIQYHICRGSQVQLGKVYNTAVFHSELHHDSVACLMVV